MSVRSTMTIARVGAAALLVGSAAAMGVVIRVSNIHLSKSPIYPADNRQVSAIPPVTPGWERVGTDRIEPAEIVETLGTHNYVTRYYVRKDTAASDHPVLIELHAAYYTGKIDTVPHVPERCFVGGGLQQSQSSRVVDVPIPGASWAVDTTASTPEGAPPVYTVRLANDPEYTDAPGRRVRLPFGVGPTSPLKMRCSEFLLPDGGSYYAGYFFVANGGTVANANQVRELAFDLTTDYAYYLKVQFNSSTVGSVEELAEQAGALLDDLIGELMRCVPDWVEVQRGAYPPGRGEGGGDES